MLKTAKEKISVRKAVMSFAISISLLSSWAVVAPAANAKVEWKMHVTANSERPETQTAVEFARLVRERTNGELDITVYAGGSLGIKETDLLRIMKGGSDVVHTAVLYPGYLTRDEPSFAFTLPPGVVNEPQKLLDLLPTLEGIYKNTFDNWGIDLVGFVGHAAIKTHVFCKEKINALADLKDKKVRVWEKFHVEVFKKLGVAAQVIPQNDLYVAMQTGVVDCAVYPASFAVTISLQEVAPFGSYLFPFVLHPDNIIVSRSAFEALSEEHKEILLETAKEITQKSMQEYLTGVYDQPAIDKVNSTGGEILSDYPDSDRKAFSEAARETWVELVEDAGGQAQENFDKVSEALK